MNRITTVRIATVREILVDYDGPQLLLLSSDRRRDMLGVAVQRDGMKTPFFTCEVSKKAFQKYFDGTADLNYAFRHAYRGRYYFFDLGSDDDVMLVSANHEEIQNEIYWPQVGIFSRSHTSNFNRATTEGSVVETFLIDGKWGASDFSRFHGKMAELYALFGVLNRLDGTHGKSEQGFIREAIKERVWQGGGSYVGFYDELMARNRKLGLIPLDVAKIRYASPGEIDLRGNSSVLSDISDVLDLFEDQSVDLRRAYRSIHGALRKERLLSADPSTDFSSEAMRDFIESRTHEFASQMQIDKVDLIFAACDENVLVFSKVFLSIYRRSMALYSFQEEGRIQRAV